MKWRIQQQFFSGKHWVWCSPAFEGEKLGKYTLGAGQPPSSDPACIYRTLHRAVTTGDGGDAKIASQKKTLMGLAVKFQTDGAISKDDQDEIIKMIELSSFEDWRPLIYVIPFEPVASRVRLVSRASRASHEPEYVIEDLADGEFDIVEPIK
jgi:hypothetical protein